MVTGKNLLLFQRGWIKGEEAIFKTFVCGLGCSKSVVVWKRLDGGGLESLVSRRGYSELEVMEGQLLIGSCLSKSCVWIGKVCAIDSCISILEHGILFLLQKVKIIVRQCTCHACSILNKCCCVLYGIYEGLFLYFQKRTTCLSLKHQHLIPPMQKQHFRIF